MKTRRLFLLEFWYRMEILEHRTWSTFSIYPIKNKFFYLVNKFCYWMVVAERSVALTLRMVFFCFLVLFSLKTDFLVVAVVMVV